MYLVTFMKSSSQLSPWLTHILKSSKRKQKLCDTFLNKNSLNKEDYKTFTCLLELIKQKSKKNYYHNLLITYENDMKRTWATIKEIIDSKNQVEHYSENGCL